MHFVLNAMAVSVFCVSALFAAAASATSFVFKEYAPLFFPLTFCERVCVCDSFVAGKNGSIFLCASYSMDKVYSWVQIITIRRVFVRKRPCYVDSLSFFSLFYLSFSSFFSLFPIFFHSFFSFSQFLLYSLSFFSPHWSNCGANVKKSHSVRSNPSSKLIHNMQFNRIRLVCRKYFTNCSRQTIVR